MCFGTPTPAVVPMPTYGMAPTPSDVWVDPVDPRRWQYGPIAAGKTPGFPFWIAGVAGHRPSSPPLDIEFDGGLPRHVITSPQVPGVTADWVVTRLDLNKELLKIGAEQLPETGTPVEVATMNYYATNTPFDDWRNPGINLPGFDMPTPESAVATPQLSVFEVNGLPPRPGAPMSDPCRDSLGNSVKAGSQPAWFDMNKQPVFTLGVPVQFGDGTERHYRIANIQIDSVFNKVGWHHAQNRIISLWDDINPTYAGTRPPEPFVFRLNTQDCATIHHVNLTPNFYELDDYEIRFPTDVIGQHTHMPKFDLPASDGAANGWNYEDGSLSPGEVHERIHALNVGFGLKDLNGNILTNLVPAAPPQLAGKVPAAMDITGARINIQRWFADPVLDNAGLDRGVGNVFTHDHFGPSTFQQLGLYATVLIEPAGSTWVHNETGVALGTRFDGGPTSWQAVITPNAAVKAHDKKPFREFFFEYSDFQSAYEAAWDGVIDADSFLFAINPSHRVDPLLGNPPINTIHPIVLFPGICPSGPGVVLPRPCPEAISLADVGTQVINYRNEPVGLRVFDPALPAAQTVDGIVGGQAVGPRGDLAEAFKSQNRRIAALNAVQASCIRNTIVNPALIKTPGFGLQFADILGRDAVPVGISFPLGLPLPCPQLTNDVGPTDPATPMMRVYNGDNVKIRIQVGATEESHDFSIHGIKWAMNYADPVSGWRNNQTSGISENFQLNVPIFSDIDAAALTADFYYSADTSNSGDWNGEWGLMRSYNIQQRGAGAGRPLNLQVLPQNPVGTAPPQIVNANQFRIHPETRRPGMCPINVPGTVTPTPIRLFDISVVRASEVLPPTATVLGNVSTLIYNPRPTLIPDFQIPGGLLAQGGQGPLHDPTAIMYVPTANVVINPVTLRPIGLTPGTAVEPLVLRANAGDCIELILRNQLPNAVDALGNLLPQADQDGWMGYPAVVDRQEQCNGVALPAGGVCPGGIAQKITFNANDTAPSSMVGIHPQLLAYDIRRDDGYDVGQNPDQTIRPGQRKTYQWYAGDARVVNQGLVRNRAQFRQISTPVEFGGTGLLPADKFEQMSKGLLGSLIINPAGTVCTPDIVNGITTQASATCTAGGQTWRDFVPVTQTAVNQLYDTPGAPDHLVNLNTALPLAASFRAVQSFKAEGAGVAADEEDSGQKGVNYKTEPLWFRLAAFPPHIPLEAMRNFPQADVLSNNVVGAGGTDPVTPIFTAATTDKVRMHFVEPGGSRRPHGIKVHGHLWQREPYGGPRDFDNDGVVDGPTTIANNPLSQKIGSQIGYGAASFYDVILDPAFGVGGPGGRFGITGDYFYGMQDPSQVFPGMWGVLRVN